MNLSKLFKKIKPIFDDWFSLHFAQAVVIAVLWFLHYFRDQYPSILYWFIMFLVVSAVLFATINQIVEKKKQS
jgi:hypothetical protein